MRYTPGLFPSSKSALLDPKSSNVVELHRAIDPTQKSDISSALFNAETITAQSYHKGAAELLTEKSGLLAPQYRLFSVSKSSPTTEMVPQQVKVGDHLVTIIAPKENDNSPSNSR